MKRKRTTRAAERAAKRLKVEATSLTSPTSPTAALLRQYYPHVLSLRGYLASRLSKCSKKRYKAVLRYGEAGHDVVADDSVVDLLDHTLVGFFGHGSIVNLESIDHDITLFTQQLSEANTTLSPTQGAFQQSETVNFAIWSLFQRQHTWRRPAHILCHGFQRTTFPGDSAELKSVPGIPGVLTSCHNPHAQTLKEHPWCSLPSLLGRKAELIISGMLMDAGIFTSIEGSSNMVQISGMPMSDLRLQAANVPVNNSPGPLPVNKPRKGARGLADIRFVRHRMLYARPALTAAGLPRIGPGHLHVLNRLRNIDDDSETIHVMKHIFPRQFGLHNVFVSDVDTSQTSQPFKDYTSREKEIAKAEHTLNKRPTVSDRRSLRANRAHLPKRLRGTVFGLVQTLRRKHRRCPFYALLQHYCPLPVATRPPESGSMHHASTPAEVSAFCCAALLRVFPSESWGSEAVGSHNRKLLLRNIDKFVRLRRYESMSLHAALQDVRISEVNWLSPLNTEKGSKLSASDFAKRRELMAELVYYVFDSFLIPLIRGSFHVTESNVHRNQLFYFRHDVWKSMTEPALSSLKAGMLEACDTATIRKLLAKRALGVSQVRLVPKENGMRPIINLRCRLPQLQRGELGLGKSINSLLTPVFSVLNYQKGARPDLLGSALFSVDDIFPRLQTFKDALLRQGHGGSPLFFAKVDVQSCFDTIPQKRLMSLARRVVNSSSYQIGRYARAKLVTANNEETPGFGVKPSWRFLTKATTSDSPFSFAEQMAGDTKEGRTRTVYIDSVVQRTESRKAILDLLEEHIEANLVRIGKRIYRQKQGIAQGSVVSSLLCSYIYAELERDVLGFLDNGQTILLRLIDDFLVISTRREVAERFMQVMHAGLPEYGVQVKAEKSRANFEVIVKGESIARLPQQSDFAYCGNAINTVTLDLSKDHERRRKSNIADSVTVEMTKLPGQTFYRKTLNALKLHMHAMLLSTTYNGLPTVLANLYYSFSDVAQKSYYYIRSLPPGKQPGDTLLIKTLDDAVKLAVVLMKRRKRTSKDIMPYECCVSNAQARWLAYTAFHAVFQRRQTRHGGLLTWLRAQLESRELRVQRNLLEPVANAYR
ncbi:Telomerase reverse transcriptase [Teratosphaeriaceae sp. CCFEE 6253]|nr:Telomerase reverse transcriptase [Teratosphaeriaceae sp. CCFEE 6253]